jgi:integrase
VKMVYMTPDFIDDYILKKKEIIIKTMKKNRYNMDHELVELTAVFNFYRKHMDFKFVTPVIKERHYPLGVIQAPKQRSKKMDDLEISLFFEAMWKLNEEGGVYAALAENQFFIAGRVQEAAAIKLSKIDFRAKVVTIDEAVSWYIRTRAFRSFKSTKTGKPRFPHINERMERNFRILISRLPPGCDLLHQIDGKPLHYYEIYKAYNRGLKAAGLFPKYSATHILRHSMAKQARIVTGSLDGAQAMGGWASVKQCEHYADSPTHMQVEASEGVEKRLRLVN